MNDYEAVQHAIELDHKISEEEFRRLLLTDEIKSIDELVNSFDISQLIYVNEYIFRDFGIDIDSKSECHLEELKKEAINHCYNDINNNIKGKTALVYSNKKFTKVYDKETKTVTDGILFHIINGNTYPNKVALNTRDKPIVLRKGAIHLLISIDMYRFLGCRMGNRRVAFTDHYFFNDNASLAYKNYMEEYINKEKAEKMNNLAKKEDEVSNVKGRYCLIS